ncbi:hypothetical protein HPC49_26385 [Pyxidicoccus fallax]|uniref:Lipoprotein n=1 Tax=Pyxidicoccus fallax TaxID=394095 RepID=A0A848LNX6_9BACT|nr:hypothetical protein [Pyxidicoccus fallax]NMO19303.1 hypothetical protein [Pyxidicoccus fallax]NPC81736.1 hypothetical protein [Pyxidicoccus fallax]
MRRIIPLCLAILATACGDEALTKEEVDAARATVERAVAAAHQTRGALEVLGVLPVYTCGEPRRSFVSRAAEGVHARYACATATVEAHDAVTDAVVMTFADGGCDVHGLRFTGQVTFLYRGGEDLMEVHADLRGLQVDGHGLRAQVGYGTCGDETRLFADVTGSVPGREGHTFHIDGRVGMRAGVPVIGGSELVLDGPGELTGPEGTDRLTVTSLLYDVGQYLPKTGTAVLETAEGRRVEARFQEVLWRVGKVEVSLDGKEPVTVPIVR